MKSLWPAALLLSAALAGAADRFDQSDLAIEENPAGSAGVKIVLLAGDPSSKTGQHEYLAGCALLSDWLKQTPGINPVLVRHGWPTRDSVFTQARSIVVFMDGGAKHPLADDAHWKKLKELTAQGVGLVVLHQGVDFPAARSEGYKEMLGGVFLPDIGCRGHWDTQLKILSGHPIRRGVTPFPVQGDGWLYNLHFADGPNFTPLVSGTVPEKSRTTADSRLHPNRDEVLAWAWQRPGGGRSFAFTGCDLHKNWELEGQRRLVVNGIFWTAGQEIPSSGAPVKFDPASLDRHLDRKPPGGVK
jgi:type 1 glutamine amidotransferase